MQVIKKSPYKDRLVLGGFFVFITIIYIVNWPLLGAPFILDDSVNLAGMSRVQSITDTSNVLQVILSNTSGVLGRPISVLSFFISDFTWPASARDHRLVNLHIHALNAILVFYFVFYIGKVLNKDFRVVALSVMFLWSLSFVNSTPVYSVIQRMTSLSALFSLLCIVVFIRWRYKSFGTSKIKDVSIFIALFLLFLLSILSKESGFLTIGFILLVEFFLKDQLKRYGALWRTIRASALILFCLSIVLINFYYLFYSDSWASRPFTPWGRFESQLVIVPQYFIKLISFSAGNTGVLQGGDKLGDWFTLTNVFIAAVFWTTAIVGSLYKSYIRPVFIITFLWFMNGHALESFFVPLELYFEHRNYLGSISIYFVLALGITAISSKVNILRVLIFVLAMFFAFSVYKNNKFLANPLVSAAIFYEENPTSYRALNTYVGELFNAGMQDEAGEIVKNASIIEKEVFDFVYGCRTGISAQIPKSFTLAEIGSGEIGLLRFIIDSYVNRVCKVDSEMVATLLEGLYDREDLTTTNKQLVAVERSRFYYSEGNFQETILSLDRAIGVKPMVYIFIHKTRLLISAGLYEEALKTAQGGLLAPSTCHYWRAPCDRTLIELISDLELILKK